MKEKIVILTTHDYPIAKFLMNYILVGDGLRMTLLGYQDTKSVTIEDRMQLLKKELTLVI